MSDQSFRNQLTRWKHKKKIIPLRNSYYLLNADDRKINPSREFIAQEIYKPSYISMEYALSTYGIIPERVLDITCITVRKTVVFSNLLGTFRYQHIKQPAFTGYIEKKDHEKLPYFMAVPEKAFVDFIYLNKEKFHNNVMAVLFDSYRCQNISMLSKKQLIKYASLFNNRKLINIIKKVK